MSGRETCLAIDYSAPDASVDELRELLKNNQVEQGLSDRILARVEKERADEQAASRPKTYLVTSIALQPTSVRPIPLPQREVFRAEPAGKAMKSPVALSVRFYDCQVGVLAGDRVLPDRSTSFGRYEVASVDPQVPYNWTLWSRRPLGNMRIFLADDGHSYLVWVRSVDVQYAEISRPNDAVEQLMKLVQKQMDQQEGVTTIPLEELLGRDRLRSGRDAFNSDIDVQSFKPDPGGSATVMFLAGEPRKAYTVVLDNGKWQVR